MHSIASSAQPTPASRARAFAALGTLVLSLLLPTSSFANEPATPPTTPPAASAAPLQAAPAAAEQSTAPVAEAPELVALRAKIAALGEQATPEQISAAQQQYMIENNIGTEAAQKLVSALQAPAAPELGAESDLIHDLSPWGMYQNADVVVKSVMIGLVLASILTWTIWLAKSIELISARRRLQRELPALKTARTLRQAAEQTRGNNSLSTHLIEDAREELALSSGCREKDGIKERVSFRLERLVAATGRQMSHGTGVLASIGSTAPFVGLFGTVWGIMNSFIGIAKSQTTNLAVVAPGIAEALLATALGLVAAIPAVIIYNVFARSITGYRAQVADASAQVLLLVSRDLDQVPSNERQSQQPHVVKVV